MFLLGKIFKRIKEYSQHNNASGENALLSIKNRVLFMGVLIIKKLIKDNAPPNHEKLIKIQVRAIVKNSLLLNFPYLSNILTPMMKETVINDKSPIPTISSFASKLNISSTLVNLI